MTVFISGLIKISELIINDVKKSNYMRKIKMR